MSVCVCVCVCVRVRVCVCVCMCMYGSALWPVTTGEKSFSLIHSCVYLHIHEGGGAPVGYWYNLAYGTGVSLFCLVVCLVGASE